MTTLEFLTTGRPQRSSDRTDERPRRDAPAAVARPHRVRNRVASAVLLLVCVTAAVSLLGTVTGRWRVETVLTGSMRPGIQPGDVELLRPEPVSALRTGQVVAFHPPGDAFTVTHRVVAIRHGTGAHAGTWITTRGDANNADDPWGSIRVLGPTVWVVRAVVPDLGYLNVWLRSPDVHLGVVVSVVLLASLLALQQVWRP